MMNLLTFLGSIVIFVSLSVDIMRHHGDYDLSTGYLGIQLVVCLIFILDFFVSLAAAGERRWRFFARNFIFLLVSIPYLNILHWTGVAPSHEWYLILKSVPLVRGLYAMWLIIKWMVSYDARNLMVSYLFTTVGFTYFSALIFYSFEYGANSHVHNFGDCLWWAWMSVTTVGAEIFAVTAAGKIFSVLLPGVGMMLFPIFTVYVTSEYQRRHARKRKGPVEELES